MFYCVILAIDLFVAKCRTSGLIRSTKIKFIKLTIFFTVLMGI
jgi:hypothetical protein